MAKFVEAHDTIINIEEIAKVDFIADDIYLGLFPVSDQGEILVDYIDFTFARIHLFSGETIDLSIDLFTPEEEETEESWLTRNRSYIEIQWNLLVGALGNITKVTGVEYI